MNFSLVLQKIRRRFHCNRERVWILNQYVANSRVRRLHIGAGTNHLQGWLNTNWGFDFPQRSDLIRLDATRPFPIPSNTFDYIFSEHVIEHLTFAGGSSMLNECFRVLKPGGKLRIVTPNFEFLVGLLSPNLAQIQRDYIAWSASAFLSPGEPHCAIAVVNNFVRSWGHTFIYDEATLSGSITTAGFDDVKRFALNVSDDPELNDREHAHRMPKGFLTLESMIMQAVKPQPPHRGFT